MKLLSLDIENFRQFRGKQRLEFATDESKNVTLIYGPNGGGKTTLLNAFTWVLYGAFTEDFERPHQLIHSDTWALAELGADLHVSATLRFEHQGDRYEVERSLTATKESADQVVDSRAGTLRVLITDERGQSSEPRNPEDLIDRILPEKLSKFFFFNGERIENLTKHSAYQELTEATKTILGLEVVSRAIYHLPRAAKTYQTELGKLGGSKAQEISDQIVRLETQAADVAEQIALAIENRTALEDRRDAVWSELQANAESRALQERRESAVRQRENADSRQDVAMRRMRELISRDGHLAFSGRLGTVVREKFAELEQKGELPAPIKEPFVRELLERGLCICGAPLHEGSPERDTLAEFLQTAGSPELESLWTRLDGAAHRLPNDCSVFQAELSALVKEEEAAIQDRKEAIERESEVSRKLTNGVDVDVQALEVRHLEIQGQMRTSDEDLGRLKSDGRRLEAMIEEKNKELLKASRHDGRSEELRECMRISDEALRALESIQSVLTEGVRQQLNRRIATTYDKISARPRVPELSSDFELRLWEAGPDGSRRQTSNSTSENTILALSFVGGLVDLARDLAEDHLEDEALRRLTEGNGGVFPIVIDAAFGSLDETYRVEVARALPKLSSQLVILLSKAQAQDTVAELAPQVGRSSVIVSHVAKADRDEDIEVGGKERAYRRVCQAGEERAELEVVA